MTGWSSRAGDDWGDEPAWVYEITWEWEPVPGQRYPGDPGHRKAVHTPVYDVNRDDRGVGRASVGPTPPPAWSSPKDQTPRRIQHRPVQHEEPQTYDPRVPQGRENPNRAGRSAPVPPQQQPRDEPSWNRPVSMPDRLNEERRPQPPAGRARPDQNRAAAPVYGRPEFGARPEQGPPPQSREGRPPGSQPAFPPGNRAAARAPEARPPAAPTSPEPGRPGVYGASRPPAGGYYGRRPEESARPASPSPSPSPDAAGVYGSARPAPSDAFPARPEVRPAPGQREAEAPFELRPMPPDRGTPATARPAPQPTRITPPRPTATPAPLVPVVPGPSGQDIPPQYREPVEPPIVPAAGAAPAPVSSPAAEAPTYGPGPVSGPAQPSAYAPQQVSGPAHPSAYAPQQVPGPAQPSAYPPQQVSPPGHGPGPVSGPAQPVAYGSPAGRVSPPPSDYAQWPVSAPAPPADYPQHPVSAPSHPTEYPQRPVSAPSQPADYPQHPVSAPSHPTEYPQRPVSAPAQSSEYAQRPVSAPSQPTEFPQRPVSAPHPASGLVQPVSGPTQPVSAPTRPVSAPGRPISAPEQPVGYGANPVSSPSHGAHEAPDYSGPAAEAAPAAGWGGGFEAIEPVTAPPFATPASDVEAEVFDPSVGPVAGSSVESAAAPEGTGIEPVTAAPTAEGGQGWADSPRAATPQPQPPVEEEPHGLGWLLSQSGFAGSTPALAEDSPAPEPEPVVEEVRPVSVVPEKQGWFAPISGIPADGHEPDTGSDPLPKAEPDRLPVAEPEPLPEAEPQPLPEAEAEPEVLPEAEPEALTEAEPEPLRQATAEPESLAAAEPDPGAWHQAEGWHESDDRPEPEAAHVQLEPDRSESHDVQPEAERIQPDEAEGPYVRPAAEAGHKTDLLTDPEAEPQSAETGELRSDGAGDSWNDVAAVPSAGMPWQDVELPAEDVAETDAGGDLHTGPEAAADEDLPDEPVVLETVDVVEDGVEPLDEEIVDAVVIETPATIETAAAIEAPPRLPELAADPEPQPDQSEPGQDQPERGQDQPEPVQDQPEPEWDQPRPEQDEAEPELDQPRPELDEAEPERDEAEPERDESAPEPQIAETDPEIAHDITEAADEPQPDAEADPESRPEPGPGAQPTPEEAQPEAAPVAAMVGAAAAAAPAAPATEPPAAPPSALIRQQRGRRDQTQSRRADPEQVLSTYPWAFDPETLRERIDDSDPMWVVIDRLSDKLEYAERDSVRARLLGLRAVAQRLVDDLDPALEDAREALEHAKRSGEPALLATTRARLAHVLHWRGEYAEADRLYAEAASPELPSRLRAEIHELAGRSAFEQNRYLEAVNHFESALDLRKGADPELVERIELALDTITRHTADGWGPYPRTREEILGHTDAPRPLRDERTGLWGYVGAVPPRYAEAQPFGDELAWARRPDSPAWELIDRAGEVVIDASAGYRAVGPFAEGLAWVSRDPAGGWYAIDRQNRVIVPGGFEDVKPFHNGLALIQRGGWGAVDQHARVVVQPRYQAFATATVDGGSVDGFTDEGLAVVDAGDRFGVIDRHGQLIVPPAHAAVLIHPSAFLIADKFGLWGALDRSGATLVEMKYPDRAEVIDEIDALMTESRPVL